MPRPDDDLFLEHMLKHAQEAVGMIAGKRRKDIELERMLELALVKLVEIVGEAAGRVSSA